MKMKKNMKMKKVIILGLIALMGLTGHSVHAQISLCNDTVFPFLETFDSGDSLICWHPLEGSNWQLIQPGTGSGNGPNKSMVSSSEYANVDSWIVSKAIALPSDTTMPVVLSWDVSATHYITYYYRYFVLVSTGDWTDRTTYDTVYADSSMQVYCGNENTNFESRMVSLDAYRGQTIHVAFCNHPLYANPYEGHWMRLNIDNVEVRDANVPIVALELPDHVYSGDSITFSATLIEGNTTGLTYTWHSSLLGITTTLNNNSLSLLYPSTGIDMVTVVATNAYGSDTATAVVSVLTHPLPQVSLSVSQQVMTDDTNVYTAVINECSPYGLVFHWHSTLLDTTITLNYNLLSINYPSAGIDTVTVVVSNIDGTDTAVAVVEVLNCNGTLIPYAEDFNAVHATHASSTDGELPTCWEGTTTGTSPAYAPHVIVPNGYTYMSNLPSYALLMVAGSDAGYGAVEQVTLPRFNQPLQNLAIAFDYRFEATERGTLSVGWLDSTNTFVGVTDMTPHMGSYRRDTVYLDSVTDSYARLALRWSYNTSYFAVAIDNIEVFNADTASMQPMVAIEVLDEVSIHDTVVYTAHLLQGDLVGLSYTWHSSLLGMNVTDVTNTLEVVYTTMGVDTLTVTATNAFGSSTATAIVTVGNCNYRSVPYSEDFESVPPRVGNTAGHLPECWSSRWTGAAHSTPYVIEDITSWNSTKELKILAGGGSTYGNGVATVVLPGFEYPAGQLSLALDYYKDDYNYGTLTVGYLLDTVYTPVVNLPRTLSDTMFRYTVDFSGIAPAGARMAIRYENPTPWQTVYIDNIEVFLSTQAGAAPVVTLDGPDMVSLYNMGFFTAQLLQGDTADLTYTWYSSLLGATWTSGSSPTFSLYYSVPGTDTLTVTATNPFGSSSSVHYVVVVENTVQVAISGSSAAWVGDTMHYVAVITGSDTNSFTYTWHSSLLDTTIVTLNPRVAVVYTSAGTDMLTVSFSGGSTVYSDTLVVDVQASACGTIASFPYFEGFEDYGWASHESCWINLLRRGNYSFNPWRRTSSYFHEGTHGFYSNGNTTENGLDAWLIMPAIELPTDSTLLFEFFIKASYIADFNVLVSPTGDNWYDSFTDTVYTLSGSGSSNGWDSVGISLEAYRGRHIRMAFVHSSTAATMSAVAIDDINLRLISLPDTTPVPQDTLWRTVSVTTNVSGAAEPYGSGLYADSSTVEIGLLFADTVSLGGHWQFLGWNDGGVGNPRNIVVTSDTAIVALFEWVADSTTGISNIENAKLKIEIYPNPAHGDVTVRVSKSSTLSVIDLTGRTVIPPTPVSSPFIIPRSSLPAGTYFVRFVTETGIAVRKMVVN